VQRWFSETGLRTALQPLTLHLRRPNSYYYTTTDDTANYEDDVGGSPGAVSTLNEVTVNFEAQAEGKAQIMLTDLTGRTVSEQVMNVTTSQNVKTINLQRCAPSIYLVRVTVDGQQLVRRVIKR